MATVLDMMLHDRRFIQPMPAVWVWLTVLALGAGMLYGVMAVPRLWVGP